MANAYSCGDQDVLAQMGVAARNQQEQLASHAFQPGQVFQTSSGIAAHTHAIGGALGGSVSATTIDDLTYTSAGTAGNSLFVNVDSGASLDWRNVQADLAQGLPDVKPAPPTNRLTKWFRINEEMTSFEAALNTKKYEPLDDLRQEMAAWLEDV